MSNVGDWYEDWRVQAHRTLVDLAVIEVDQQVNELKYENIGINRWAKWWPRVCWLFITLEFALILSAALNESWFAVSIDSVVLVVWIFNLRSSLITRRRRLNRIAEIHVKHAAALQKLALLDPTNAKLDYVIEEDAL